MTFLANYAAFETAMGQLAANHTTLCTRIELGHRALESSRRVFALRISPTSAPAGRPAAVILGGVHAREVASPPAVLSFGTKLLNAYATNSDVTYPAFSDGPVPYAAWSILAADVKRILDGLVLIVVPVVNPDGRDQVVVTGDAGWRGNRNTAACPGFGVDLNRNFDIGWDTAKYYSAADESVIVPLGTDPTCSDSFRGPPPGPGVPRVIEPETLNIQELVDNNDVRYLVDVHSFGRRVLTPWGLADNQDTDRAQNFANAAFDRRSDGTGGRSVLNGAYKEYLPNDSPHRVKVTHEQLAQAMTQAILDQAGPNATARARSTYLVRQIPYLYKEALGLAHIVPVPGSTVDYAVARQFKPGETAPAFGLAMEIGYSASGLPGTDAETEGGFRPTNLVKFQKIERETHAGLAALLKAAVGAATGKKRKKS